MTHQFSLAHKQLIQIAIVAILLIGCVAVLLPFTGTLLLAVVICTTISPARDRLVALCREHPVVTLIYGAHDREHNQAVVLAEVLTERLGSA